MKKLKICQIFISPTEKFTDEFTDSVKELKGLFKVPKSNTPAESLHQQICNTAKRQFDKTNGIAVSMVWILQKMSKSQIGLIEPVENTEKYSSLKPSTGC